MLNTLQIILLTVIALSGIPAGFFIAKATKEELKPGRKWFKIILGLSLAVAITSPFTLDGSDLALALTASAFVVFMSIMLLLAE